ncbi:unnamed protein product, partial [Polarella glacialis]
TQFARRGARGASSQRGAGVGEAEIRVLAFADVACPWCYVGKAGLESAIEQIGPHRVKVEWLPFFVETDASAQGEDLEIYGRRRWGGLGWTLPLRRMGAAVGLKFQSWRWWPSRMLAHRLLYFAGTQGVEVAAVLSALHEALFERGENISDADLLASLAEEDLGLDRQQVLEFLSSEAGTGEMLLAMSRSKAMHGVKVVPHFVISATGADEALVLTGSYPPEHFLAMFKRVLGEDESTPVAEEGSWPELKMGVP